MDKEQLIQDYIAFKLTPKDRTTVEELLNTDPNFKKDFEAYKDIAVAFKLSEANRLKKRLQDLEGTYKKQVKTTFNYKYLLAAASIIAIALFFNLYSKDSGGSLFKSNFEVYPNAYQPVTRASNTQGYNQAFVAYENDNFALAETEFETILKTSNNLNIRFYYACALLNQSKIDLALEQFELLNKENHDYAEESLWFTALIHTKQERFNQAIETLEQLNTKHAKFKSKERKVLLQKLKDL